MRHDASISALSVLLAFGVQACADMVECHALPLPVTPTMMTSSASHAAVQVDASQPYGILITNGEFTAFCDAPSFAFCNGPGNNASPVHVRVGAGNKGAVKFSNSAFWGTLWCDVVWCGVCLCFSFLSICDTHARTRLY